MKVVLDEQFLDEKCQFHHNLDESVPNLPWGFFLPNVL